MQSFQPILVIITRVDSNGDFYCISDGYFMFDRPPAASRTGKYASLSSPVKTVVYETANAQIVTNSLRQVIFSQVTIILSVTSPASWDRSHGRVTPPPDILPPDTPTPLLQTSGGHY